MTQAKKVNSQLWFLPFPHTHHIVHYLQKALKSIYFSPSSLRPLVQATAFSYLDYHRTPGFLLCLSLSRPRPSLQPTGASIPPLRGPFDGLPLLLEQSTVFFAVTWNDLSIVFSSKFTYSPLLSLAAFLFLKNTKPSCRPVPSSSSLYSCSFFISQLRYHLFEGVSLSSSSE